MSTFDTETTEAQTEVPRFFDGTGTQQGNSLLMVTSGWALITDFEDFLKASGLDPAQVFTGIEVRSPIPVYPDNPPKRWPWGEVPTEVSRSPLFWLPDGLVERMVVFGDPEPEVDEHQLVDNLLAIKEQGAVSRLGDFGPLPLPGEEDVEWAERFAKEVHFDDAFTEHLKALGDELGVDLLSGVIIWKRHPERVEADDEWAMRIALVMQESGLYDPEKGWVDVFAAHGIDIDDPMTRLDFEAWAEGASSHTFDGISLDRWLGQYEGDWTWAQEVIAAQGEAVIKRATALLAREAVIEFVGLTPNNLDDREDPLPKDDAVDYALVTAQVAWGMLHHVTPDGLDSGDSVFDRLIGELEQQPDYDTLISTILPPVVEWLLEVQNRYWKWFELLSDPEAYAEATDDEIDTTVEGEPLDDTETTTTPRTD